MAADGGFRQTVETVPASWGLPTKSELTAKFDGKETAVRGNANADTQAFTKISEYNYEVVSRKGGKVTLTARVMIAADGKTRTATQSGTNAQGQKVNNTLVYERQ